MGSSSASSPSVSAETTTSPTAVTPASSSLALPSATGPAALPAAPREAGATPETTTDQALDTSICAPTCQERCLDTPTPADKLRMVDRGRCQVYTYLRITPSQRK